MKIEIEAKVVVEDLKPISEAARLAGAESRGTIAQHDIYYSDPFGKLLKTGCGLRIRQQSGDVNRTILTFKGPVSKGPYKTRPEIEVEIGNRESMQQLMDGLGYQIVIEIRKKRQTWILGDCEVCLDEVEGLGRFVEVEGPNDEAITQTLRRIGLGEYVHISRGYASLMMEKMGINKITWGKTFGKAKPRFQRKPRPKGGHHKDKPRPFRRDDRKDRGPRDPH